MSDLDYDLISIHILKGNHRLLETLLNSIPVGIIHNLKGSHINSILVRI